MYICYKNKIETIDFPFVYLSPFNFLTVFIATFNMDPGLWQIIQ